MSDRINQVFAGGREQRRNGRIVDRSRDGIYTVQTISGARLRAESEVVYHVGERVTVLQGHILGRTGGAGAGRIFDV